MRLSETLHVTEAIRVLAGPSFAISAAAAHVPGTPGLYAVHATPATWRLLGLDSRPTDIPLYVGKAEDSLVRRELKTHFAVGRTGVSKTGSSTLRRSFAALLRGYLDLRAVPRNTSKPGHFANFALESEAEERLTDWMHATLTLAVWPKPDTLELNLQDIEKGVLTAWGPPMNLNDVPAPSSRLRAARKVMADEARAWARANDSEL